MIAHDDRWHFEFDSHSGGRTCPFSPAITRSMPRNPRHAARLRQKTWRAYRLALHRVFDSPRDRFIFDVSHQSYVHKMLTGRAEAYLDQSRFDEVTGFTNPLESEHDSFVLGHTGTSISLACGLAKTRDMQRGAAGESTIGNVIAIIGDGSLSSAIAFEGLNNAAEQGGNLIIIVNDNEMSIAEDFGGMYGQLAKLRTSNGMAELNLFKAFGLDYRYVEQGNDVDALVEVLNEVKDIDHPIVVHIHTTKGLGFNDETEADNGSDGCNQTNPQPHAGQCEANHWQDPEASLGKPLDARKYYGEMAMASLERRFDNEPGLVVISPATPGSNGITRDFRERAGAHYVDTGITEEHAAAFAAGIARAGGACDFRHVLPTHVRPAAARVGIESCSRHAADFRRGNFRRGQYAFGHIRYDDVRQCSRRDLFGSRERRTDA